MNAHNPYTKKLFILTLILFCCSAYLYLIDDNFFLGLSLVSGLVLLALLFRSITLLKGFSYTVLILAAVTVSLFYPSRFIAIGDFQLKWLVVPFVQLTMFGMGAHMSFEDFKGVVKMPKGVLIGIFCHYLMMPLVGFALSKMFNFPAEIAGGVILIGCVPSAMASNVMSYLAKANLALAVTIGACSTVLSPFVTPFLMKLLGGQYVEVDISHMMIDITNMIIIPVVAGFIFNLFYYGTGQNQKGKTWQMVLFAVIVMVTNVLMSIIVNNGISGFLLNFTRSIILFYLLPMLLAVILRNIKNLERDIIESSLSFLAMLGIIINTVIITASGRDNLLQVGGLLVITCFLHNISGFGIGYGIAKLFKLPEKDRRTIAFEVGMQNGGVATGLALQMGKVATVGLASAIFGPLQNVTGSILANWFRKRNVEYDSKPNEERSSNVLHSSNTCQV